MTRCNRTMLSTALSALLCLLLSFTKAQVDEIQDPPGCGDNGLCPCTITNSTSGRKTFIYSGPCDFGAECYDEYGSLSISQCNIVVTAESQNDCFDPSNPLICCIYAPSILYPIYAQLCTASSFDNDDSGSSAITGSQAGSTTPTESATSVEVPASDSNSSSELGSEPGEHVMGSSTSVGDMEAAATTSCSEQRGPEVLYLRLVTFTCVCLIQVVLFL